jgi:hypothetical protein
MNVTNRPGPDSIDTDSLAEANSLPGIIAALGELKPGSIVTEEGVARLFNRHVASVKRAVQRGELPPPCRLFGTNVWTAGILVQYIENRLEQAAKEAERDARRLANLSTLPQPNRRP